MDATVNKNILSFHLIDKIAGCDRMNKHFVTTRCFLLPVSFAKLFLGDSFDPFPVPDDVEEQAEHHDVPAVRVYARDDTFEGASAASSHIVEEMKVENDTCEDANEAAEEQQQVQVEVFLHGNPFFLSFYVSSCFSFSLRERHENTVEI